MKHDEQELPPDVPVVPALNEEDRKEIIKNVQQAAKEAEHLRGQHGKKCLVCGEQATHCMRGLPNNTYCKPCAQEHFKFLNYLERL